jgi:hypothetical protein
LSQGTLVAKGIVSNVVDETGTKDIGQAFARLSRIGETSSAEQA